MKGILKLDHEEQGIVIRALNGLRNDLIQEEHPTEAVDELLLKAIQVREKKSTGRKGKREYGGRIYAGRES